MTLASARHWAFLVAGGVLLKAGCRRLAGALLERATAMNPQHALTQSSRAIALLQLGDWEDAAAGFRAAIALDPADRESWANLVAALLHLARWEEAVVVCRRAIERDPDRAGLHEHLGIALTKLERWDAAVDVLCRAVVLNPDSTEGNTLLHYALLKMERWEEALDALRRVIAREPGSPQLRRGLGTILTQLGRWEEAAEAFRQALALAPDQPEAYVGLASALARIPASSERTAADRRAVDAAPDDATAYLRLGLGLAALERWQDAVTALTRGSALARTDNVFQYLLVDPLARLGRGEEALAAYRRAATSGGPRPDLPAEAAAGGPARPPSAFWSKENLPERVFRIERWLAQLAVSRPAPASAPRLLFVLDADYGELTTLMYLVLGRAVYSQGTLLLPERLFENNPDALRGRTRQYRSVDDILQVVDQERPDVVFLCSGYLFPVHYLLSVDDLARLVGGLRRRGCRVVTADPFLGMFSQRAPRDLVTIDIPSRPHDREFMRGLLEVKKAEEERLWTVFTGAEAILRDTYHLYPAFCDVPPREATATDARNLSFFNPALVCPELATGGAGASSPAEGARPHWLFVLSRTDYEAQQLFETLPGFIDLVVEKLLETLAAGRHPILIAPSEMIAALGCRLPTTQGMDLVAHCSFNQFTSLLLGAEHAFYWNVLSHSLLIRLFNNLPNVVFDRGHLIRNVPAVYPRVIQWYYQGWEPPLIDHRQALTLESVAAWTEPYRQNAQRLGERFRRAPTPEDMIAAALDRHPVSAPAPDTPGRLHSVA